jgi:Rod binding domain-containing protein
MSTGNNSSITGSSDMMALASQARSSATSAGQSSQVSSLLNGKGKTPEQIKEAAQDFEAFFLSQMLQPMFDTVQTDEMFGGGEGEEMWKSMMVDEYAKQIAKSGGVGVAEQVMQVMIQAQESEK